LLSTGKRGGVGEEGMSHTSAWSKDLWNIREGGGGVDGGWFDNNISREVDILVY
jgi:hypothetical protein